MGQKKKENFSNTIPVPKFSKKKNKNKNNKTEKQKQTKRTKEI